MTAQQAKTIRTINDKIEADCWVADQAARDVAELDVVSVLLVVKTHIEAGRIEQAKQIVAQWKAGTL